jgi:methyltransferase (TIGR00027 family)
MGKSIDASQTAMLIASLRAMSCYEEDPCIRGNDYIAEIFLPLEKSSALHDDSFRPKIRQMIPAGLYEYVIARTAWFDQLLIHHLALHTSQIVILGAGFDSRAIRFSSSLGNSIIFELDQEATLDAKQQIFRQNQIVLSDHVRFVTTDFENDLWYADLIQAGFDPKLDSLFIWEGVTFYLTPQAVSKTLSQLTSCMNQNSALSFDYQHTDAQHALFETGLKDEKILFGLDERSIDSYLQSFGLSLKQDLDAEALEERFLTMSSGQLFGRINPVMRITLVTSKKSN